MNSLFNARKSTALLTSLLGISILCYSCADKNSPQALLSPEEKVSILISRSLQQTGVLVSSADLNDAFFKKHYVSRKLQPAFVTMYGLLHKKARKVLDEFKSQQSVIHFLLQKHLTLPLDSVTDYSAFSHTAIARNPLYMAYALIMEELPDVSKIGNPLYMKQLAKSFGVTELEIFEGIWYYLQESDPDIFRKVALMIRDNVESEKSKKPDFFFQNILLPFLTYTSMSLVVHPSIEKKLLARFSEAFKDGRVRGIKNVLFDFTVRLRRYLLGDSFHVRYLNNLNRVLMMYEFRMFVIEKTCIGYKIIEYNIPINKRGVGEVRFLKKMSISLSLNYLGLSMLKEKDVVLTLDNFFDCTDDILYTIKNKQPAFNSYNDLPIGKYWEQLHIGFPCVTADSIYAKLIKKEFGRQSREEIMNRLFREIAIHEVKHKWDENIKDDIWYNVDNETSAHIAEILYGGVPLYSLLSFIHRYQVFYCKIDIGEVKEQLQPVIASCWQLARQAANDTISADQVMQELRIMYDEYKVLEGKGSLPDIDLFYTEIVEPCFRHLPTLAMSSIKQ